MLNRFNLNSMNKPLRLALYAFAIVFSLSTIKLIADAPDLTSIGTASSALLLSVPIAMAALGGLFSERSGVVNIGLEGMMIMGAWGGGVIGCKHGPWLGLLAGIVMGALGALLHAIATVGFGVDHVVSGVAINIIAAGIIPAGLEMMDKITTGAVEPFVNAGYPLDAEAILLCESDGTPEEVADEIERMKAVMQASGATELANFVPRTYNIGASVVWGRLETRLTYHYKSGYLSGYSPVPVSQTRVFDDPTVDLNLQYRLRPALTLYVDYINIFNNSPDWWHVTKRHILMSELYGSRLNVGVSGRF